MKTKRMFLTLALLSGMTLLAGSALAQEQPEMTRVEFERIDSIKAEQQAQEVIQAQREEDATRMSDAKEAHNKTKAQAKETRRVDREASSAAREAKLALRAEKKAQKARRDADRQSRSAEKAKTKSDKN